MEPWLKQFVVKTAVLVVTAIVLYYFFSPYEKCVREYGFVGTCADYTHW